MRQEWEIYVCYIENITEILLLNCIHNKTEQKLLYPTQEKTCTVKSYFCMRKKTQKAGKHHTDEIEAHRYQVADELKGKHIHIVDDFEQTHPHSPQHNHIHNIYS